jgi:protein-disulfide isomerase
MQAEPAHSNLEAANPRPVAQKQLRHAGLKASAAQSARRSMLLVVLLPLFFGLGLGSGYLLWGRQAATVEQAAGSQAINPDEIRRYDVSPDDDPSLGPAGAQITIVEFSDFECPFCTKWYAEVWPQIQAAYPSQVRLVYRDFPLTSIHSNAIAAAEAAHCAGDQNAYWEYHNLLFASEYGLGKEAYLRYAGQLNLDSAAFNECLESRRYQDEVQADYEYAANLGIRSTPTFFINGIAVVGAQPFAVFKQVIDLELAGELPQ